MRFNWDDRKNRINMRKHGLLFEDAMEVFQDPFRLTIEDDAGAEEVRYWCIGRLRSQTVVVVVPARTEERGEEVIRVISKSDSKRAKSL